MPRRGLPWFCEPHSLPWQTVYLLPSLRLYPAQLVSKRPTMSEYCHLAQTDPASRYTGDEARKEAWLPSVQITATRALRSFANATICGHSRCADTCAQCQQDVRRALWLVFRPPTWRPKSADQNWRQMKRIFTSGSSIRSSPVVNLQSCAFPCSLALHRSMHGSVSEQAGQTSTA